MKNVKTLCTIFFGVVILLFWGIAYPNHLHFQEEYQLFLFDSAYVWEIVRLPGGISDLLGRFCTQFFLYAWVGAFIIAVMLSVVQLLTLRLVCWGRFYVLSFLPAFLLWGWLLDEHALLGGVWAIILTLFVSWIYDRLPNGVGKKILLIALIPMLYWIAGPLCILFFLLHAPRFMTNPWYYVVFVLFAVMVFVSSCCLPVQPVSLWRGIHYYRYPSVFPLLLWVAALSVFFLVLIARVFSNWASAASRNAVIIGSFALLAVCMGGLVWKNSNFKAEKVMGYDFMACHQQWNRILETVEAEKPNNQIGVTVQNLALGMRGMLLNHMFEYNQNGMLGLLPDVERDATTPMPTAEAFYQLGMINIAQRTVFEAQEAILDFQKSGRCYKRLAQTNLINGNYEVARKYLLALQKTIFYRDWADETMLLLGNEKAIARHPEYGRLRQMRYRKDFFFSDHTTPQMLEELYNSNRNNHLAYEYMMAAFALTGDRDNFLHYAPKNR